MRWKSICDSGVARLTYKSIIMAAAPLSKPKTASKRAGSFAGPEYIKSSSRLRYNASQRPPNFPIIAGIVVYSSSCSDSRWGSNGP